MFNYISSEPFSKYGLIFLNWTSRKPVHQDVPNHETSILLPVKVHIKPLTGFKTFWHFMCLYPEGDFDKDGVRQRKAGGSVTSEIKLWWFSIIVFIDKAVVLEHLNLAGFTQTALESELNLWMTHASRSIDKQQRPSISSSTLNGYGFLTVSKLQIAAHHVASCLQGSYDWHDKCFSLEGLFSRLLCQMLETNVILGIVRWELLSV